jgi:hypothetical protein
LLVICWLCSSALILWTACQDLSPRWQAVHLQMLAYSGAQWTWHDWRLLLQPICPGLKFRQIQDTCRWGWLLLINMDNLQKKETETFFLLLIPKRFWASCLSVGSWCRGSGSTGLMWRLEGEIKFTLLPDLQIYHFQA